MNNFELNHEELLGKRKILESYPRTVFVELTRNCNMHCTCCRPEIIADKSLNMSDELLAMVEKELFPTAKVIDFRGWGESTLDDRLLGLVQRWMGKNKELFIYSNCQSRTPEYWETLFKSNLNVAISLRAARKELYEKYMRGASHEKLISHLEEIPENNKVLFTVIVDDENIDEIEGIVQLAAKYHIFRIHLNPLVQRKFKEDYPTFGVSKEKRGHLLAKLKHINRIAAERGIRVEVCSDLLNEDKHDLKQCIHPWSYVYIAYNGDIGFCDHLMCVDDAMMGNVQDGFDKVWNNEKYQEVRRMHSCHELGHIFGDRIECRWCYKNRYANWEHLLERDKNTYELGDYIKMKTE